MNKSDTEDMEPTTKEAGMNKATVTFPDGTTDQRKTGRTYTHAVIAFKVSTWEYQGGQRTRVPLEKPEWIAYSYHGSAALAAKGRETAAKYGETYSEIKIVEVVNIPVAKRTRVRCTGLKLQGEAGRIAEGIFVSYARAMQCTRDAVAGERCKEHADTDNEAIKAQADRTRAAFETAWKAHYDRVHAEKYTVETCPIVNGCDVHGKAPVGVAR